MQDEFWLMQMCAPHYWISNEQFNQISEVKPSNQTQMKSFNYLMFLVIQLNHLPPSSTHFYFIFLLYISLSFF